MKSLLLVFIFLSMIFSIGCKKTGNTPVPPPVTNGGKCKPITESTTLSGNQASYEYTYSGDGTISSYSKYGPGHGLVSSTLVSYVGTKTTSPSSVKPDLTDSFNVYYDADIYNHSPQTATVWVTLDGVTQVDYKLYSFSYDSKDRLIKVSESTPHIVGDGEYDLTITYNDQDNVTSLKYESTSGPAGVTVIQATGYDDKPNPFAGIKNWRFMMHADWTNSDPEPLFTGLSKNNLSGYTYGNFTRTTVYTYTDNGFPSKRVNTNTNPSGSATFEEAFDYNCN